MRLATDQTAAVTTISISQPGRNANGRLADGTALDGPATLRRALIDRSDAVATTATEKLLTYALGRRVEHFDMPAGTPGLANLMAGTAKIEDCIQRIGGIDIIPAGVVPPNPLELLASPRFAKFLEMAKGRYDRIIVDSPPSQAVSDAILLSTFANEVIYVVKAEGTAIPLVQKGVGQLLHSGASITGVVFNQVDVTGSARYSGYYDYYGYSERQA